VCRSAPIVLFLCFLEAAPSSKAKPSAAHLMLTKSSRLAFIQRAQIWTRTDIPNMNLRLGPGEPGAFQPDELVTCDYVDVPRHGATRKFHCALRGDDVVKVRYGAHNGEVEGSVLSTRLLWALGFAADRVYPVRVSCRGCSADPWNDRRRISGTHEFDHAVIERKPHGREMWEGHRKAGWAWPELDLVDESVGGAPREQRDALKLVAVLIQHGDSKPQQQRLLCKAGALTNGVDCEQPFLVLHDVGVTFGRANFFNRGSLGSANFEAWARTPVWKNAGECVGHLNKSDSGTLDSPRISEAGRRFLAGLLLQLTHRQLRDLFEVARVERRSPHASVEDWVAAFDRKRAEIVENRCAH
jgi:hypothetical protein